MNAVKEIAPSPFKKSKPYVWEGDTAKFQIEDTTILCRVGACKRDHKHRVVGFYISYIDKQGRIQQAFVHPTLLDKVA